jgi:two-component system response regulator HydG
MNQLHPQQPQHTQHPQQPQIAAAKAAAQLRLINELGLKLQSLVGSENIFQEIVEAVQNKFHYYSFSIWQVNANGTATLKAQSGAYNSYMQVGFTIEKGAGITGTVVETRRTYNCDDVSADSHFTKFEFPVETKSQLSVPVIVDGNVVAVFSVESNEPRAFNEDDIACFESVVHQLEVVLTNSRLFQEVKSFNAKLQETVKERTIELKKANQRILEQQKLLQKENATLKTLANRESPPEAGTIVHKSEAMVSILGMVDKIAPTTATVVILGESGTGKELIARRLHFQSERKDKPYVTINCGALQENLLESELFGHEKGSFTGAHVTKMGLAEVANGGTLFLDEIGEMSMAIQAKLLRFLQEGEVYRIGGKKPIKVDVRIISATNKDLEVEVKKGRFREDLFYRLNTITLRLPPLRKRREDIRPLIDHFLKSPKVGGAMTHIKRVDPKVYEILENYDWPGNIRELQNTIERLKILAENQEIVIEDVPFNIRMPRTRTDGLGVSPESVVDLSLDELEKHHILRTLTFFGHNKTRAAGSLGITIKTLYNKLHKYGLIAEGEGKQEPKQLYPQ